MDYSHKYKNVEFPDIFYKYCPLEGSFDELGSRSRRVLDSIIDDKFFFSHVGRFNDPFDKYQLSYEGVKDEKVEEYFYKYISPGLAEAEWGEVLSDAKRNIRDRGFHRGLDVNLHDNLSVLSLSSSYDNILMWSHYASNHEGVCVGLS